MQRPIVILSFDAPLFPRKQVGTLYVEWLLTQARICNGIYTSQ